MGNILYGIKLSFCNLGQKQTNRGKRSKPMYSEDDSPTPIRANKRIHCGDEESDSWDEGLVDLRELKNKTGYRINDRFEVVNYLGAGSFGMVFKVKDKVRNNVVAMKISKGDSEEVKKEVLILKKLNKLDIHNKGHIVRMFDEFAWQGRHCVTEELLAINMFRYLTRHHPQGLCLEDTTVVAYQVLETLEFLSNRNMGHCDLKPENIMLTNIGHMRIKVIDFGSAETTTSMKSVSYFQTRFYRAPEVMLGIPLSPSVDMWSLGCIIAELHTGYPLFYGSDEIDQVNKMIEVLGIPSTSVLIQGSCTHRYFHKSNRNRSAVYTPIKYPSKPKYGEPGTRSLESVLTKQNGEQQVSQRHQSKGRVYESWIIELVSQMLEYDSVKRITATRAKRHILFHSVDRNNYIIRD